MKSAQQSGARRAKRGVLMTTLQRAMMLVIVVMTAAFLALVCFTGQRYAAPVEIKYDRLFRGANQPEPSAPAPSLRSFFKQRASALNADQQLAVDMTKHAWTAYRDHADWKDFLNVKTMKGGTVYAHDMALTLVDSLDTLFVLGLHDEFDEASAWVKANLESIMLQRGYVSFFEITIRSLGGLLSAYYLSGECIAPAIYAYLKAGLTVCALRRDGPGEGHFLDLANTLASRLTRAFLLESTVPYQKIDLVTGAVRVSPTLAEANTFQLEFAYLAHATKNATYTQYVDRINKMMQEMVAEHHPDGQIPVRIDWKSKRGARSQISWGALGDSYYEYLLKQWLLSNKQDDELRKQYVIAVDGMRAKLLGTSYPSKFVFLTEMNRHGDLSHHMEHLTCFVPGLLALGYIHGMPKEHLDLAKELARTCVEMYLAAASKVAPEITHFTTEESYDERERLGELFVYEQQDFNILRPETVESPMVLHRATGDPIYRAYGRTIMNALETHCRVAAGGYRSISGVFYRPVRSHRPDMESFFVAETLKYLYLLFSDDDVLPLDAIVLNTEAHPFPILGSMIPPPLHGFFSMRREEGREVFSSEKRSLFPDYARETQFSALMGAALCSCGGRADDDHALLFGVALDKAKLLQQQHRHALLGFAKSPHKYAAGKSPLDQHGSLYHSRGETYELSDDVYAAAAQDDDDPHHHRTVLLVNRHSSALAIAEAFRMKLQESPISAHEKMQFLLAPRAATSPRDQQQQQGESETQDAQHHPSDEGSSSYDDDDESVSDEDWKQRANPLLSIIVPPGPCGLVLQVENEPGLPPIVDGFVRRYDGKKGVIENSGMVQKGSVLCAINDIDVSRMPLKEVVRTLNLSSHLERKFVFRDATVT